MTDLAEFLATYASETTVLDIDLQAFKTANPGQSPMIIVRDRGVVVAINPMPLSDYLDVDVHPFVDGKSASAAVLGFSPDNRLPGFAPEDTPLRSDGRPAARLVAVLVGKQSEVAPEAYCNHDPVAVVNGRCECGAVI